MPKPYAVGTAPIPHAKQQIEKEFGHNVGYPQQAREDAYAKIKMAENLDTDAETMRRQVKDVAGAALTGKKPIPSYKKGGTVKETGLAYVHKGEKVTPANHGGRSSAPKGMSLHSITTKRLKDGSFHHEHRFNDKDGNPHHITHEYSSATNRDAGDHVAEQFEQGPMPDGQANAPETVPTGEQPQMQPEMAGV